MAHYSAEPSPEQMKLHGAKARCFHRIKPYENRVKKPEFVKLQVDIRNCTCIAEVERLYEGWRSMLAFRKIANLPDFNSPGKQTSLNAAA